MRLRCRLADRILVLAVALMLSPVALAQQELRTITVSGSGSSSVMPDRANVQMSVVARSATLGEAQRTAAEVTGKVLEMTDSLGIDRDQIDTTGSSVRPDYRWNKEREEQELRGYIVDRQMNVEVQDLDKLGALVEGALELSVNQVYPPQLDSSNRREAYRTALAAAAKDAQANAKQLAEALGASVGEVLQITTVSQPAPPMPYMRATASLAMDQGAPETYNAANLEFDATVTAVFELR